MNRILPTYTDVSRWFFWTAWLIVLAGCGNVDPKPPEFRYNALPEPEPQTSTLCADAHLPISDLERLANRKIPQNLFSKSNIHMRFDSQLDLDIQRDGHVSMAGTHGRVFTDIPIKASGRVLWQKSIGFKTLKHDFEMDAELVFRLETTVQFNDQWELVPHTKSSYTWIKKPAIPLVAGLKVNVAGLVEKKIEGQLEKLIPELDQLLSDLVNLKKIIEPVWFKLGMSVALQKQPPVWLRANPSQVSVSPLTIESDTVYFDLSIQSAVEIFLGNQPPPRRILKMQPLVIQPDTLQRSKIHVSTTITYEDASTLISENLMGKVYSYKDKAEIKIGTVNVYGNGSFLVIALDFDATLSGLFSFGDAHGRVYLTGKPVYDAARQVLRVDSLDYDLNSHNMLARTADWMVSDAFIQHLQSELVFPLSKQISTSREKLQNMLAHVELGLHIVIQGNVLSLVPQNVYLGTTDLQIYFSIDGTFKAALSLEDL